MKKILLALALCLLPVVASAQCTGVFAAGRVCGSLLGGVPQPVPFTSFGPGASANANTVYAGPTSGAAAPATFRALIGADLPLPTAVTLGAVFSKTAVASNWLRSLGTDGNFTASQPSFADQSGSITLAQFPTQAADTVLGRWAAGTGVPSATAVPDCSGALNYSTTTHLFSCNTSSIPAAPDQVANCSLAATVSANALTIALKDQTGADPSSPSPCTVAFRSATAATGTYSSVAVTSALSFSTGTTGSTFGSTNSVPFRLWITAWNNAGTLVLGVSKQSVSPNVFPINEDIVQSSTACSACTTATSAGVYYTTAAQTSKAIRILGYMDWSAGLATAGQWASGPTTIQMFGQGIKKPGDVIQVQQNFVGTVASGTTVIPFDNTIPQNTEGDQYLSQAITPSSTPNILEVSALANLSNASVGAVTMALFQDAVANALAAARVTTTTALSLGGNLSWTLLAATTSSTTFKIRAGGNGAGTTTFNGESGSQLYGGVMNSFIRVREIQG